MDSRFSPRGSALRALILVLGCVALIWIGYLLLPPALQAAEVETFVRVLLGLGIVGVVVAISNRPAPKTRTFWLSQDGESEPCGPYSREVLTEAH